jgi:hypothetical protein
MENQHSMTTYSNSVQATYSETTLSATVEEIPVVSAAPVEEVALTSVEAPKSSLHTPSVKQNHDTNVSRATQQAAKHDHITDKQCARVQDLLSVLEP